MERKIGHIVTKTFNMERDTHSIEKQIAVFPYTLNNIARVIDNI